MTMSFWAGPNWSGLTALGERLASRDVTADVFVVGGAATALAYDANRATPDVDTRFMPYGIVLAEARRVAAVAEVHAEP